MPEGDTAERRTIYIKDGVRYVKIEKIQAPYPPEGKVSPDLRGLTPDQKRQINSLRGVPKK
jgi:hypothetical protein